MGKHVGWDYIASDSRYPERKPLLGWYDERFVEASDWQTKWMVEHGVTFKLES